MWFMVCRWPQSHEGDWAITHLPVQVSTIWVLTCPETVYQRPRMMREIEMWCNYLSETRCHSLSLASVKSRLVLPFWYRLTRVVPEKGLLNGCVCIYKWLHSIISRSRAWKHYRQLGHWPCQVSDR